MPPLLQAAGDFHIPPAVQITNVGDSTFMLGEHVEWWRFSEENERVPLGIYAALLIVPGSHGNICFQPQDGAYVMFMSVLVELNESVCVPLICEAYR